LNPKTKNWFGLAIKFRKMHVLTTPIIKSGQVPVKSKSDELAALAFRLALILQNAR